MKAPRSTDRAEGPLRTWEGRVEGDALVDNPTPRADVYLAEIEGLLSRSQLKARNATIRVNGREVKASRVVKPGDKIELSWREEPSSTLVPEEIPLSLIYEDDRCLVVDKAQGMVTHPGHGNHRGTLANAVLGLLAREAAQPEARRPRARAVDCEPAPPDSSRAERPQDRPEARRPRARATDHEPAPPDSSRAERPQDQPEARRPRARAVDCEPAPPDSSRAERPQDQPEARRPRARATDYEPAPPDSSRAERPQDQPEARRPRARATDCEPAPLARAGIVHRLDKDTSGLIIVAKDNEAQAFLAAQFKQRTTRKEYLAIVRGLPFPRSGRIEDRLGRDRRDRKRFASLQEGGKPAVTDYRVLSVWPAASRPADRDEAYALVSLKPRTGRTHQLRVHMAALGTPIVGDPLYGRQDRRFPEATLMLHAYRLKISLPDSGGPSLFRAPLPERLKRLLRDLEKAFGKGGVVK